MNFLGQISKAFSNKTTTPAEALSDDFIAHHVKKVDYDWVDSMRELGYTESSIEESLYKTTLRLEEAKSGVAV